MTASGRSHEPARTPVSRLGIALLLAVAAGCLDAGGGPGPGSEPGGAGTPWPRPGDLVIVDADAGQPSPAGSPLGVLFLSRALPGGGYGEPELLASDPRWVEPLDVLILPDERMLVLESHGEPVPGEPRRGALYMLHRTGAVERWWTDAASRQPVGMALAADGTLYVSDRAADPLALGRDTGAVFVIPPRFDPRRRDTRTPRASVLAGPELVTPAGLLATSDGRVLLMDADANPDGHAGTPGVLFEILESGLQRRLAPSETTSPIGLIERGSGELFLVDCNEGRDPGVYADGALFRIESDRLVKLIDSYTLGRPRGMHDPALGDTLPDGRLVVADLSADPLGLGEDGSPGFMGSGPGAVLVIDPEAGTVEPLVASAAFVTPLAVRRAR